MFEREKSLRQEKEAATQQPTLLRVELQDYDLEGLVAWVQRFPYAAVLPVQPLMLKMTEEGVNVMFRKKPTKERGSVDGGLKITVQEMSITWDSHRWPGASRGAKGLDDENYHDTVEADGKGRQGGTEQYDKPRVLITVTRIAEGQAVEKRFTEKLVAKKLLATMKEEGFALGSVVAWFSNDLSFPEI